MVKGMNKSEIKNILNSILAGNTNINDAVEQLDKNSIYSDLDFAKIDITRKSRCGFPEFIYGEGKTIEQLQGIIKNIKDNGENILATRINKETGVKMLEFFPNGEYNQLSRTFSIIDMTELKKSNILIVTAGTTDLAVAIEAKKTVEACGFNVKLLSDIGVAGIHRLFAHSAELENASVIITVAGMEGALPSVIGGLVSCPVIAVPTSVGYGSSLNGLTAMFAMLNSCASGITVVNIDNGFGAGCAAVRICNQIEN